MQAQIAMAATDKATRDAALRQIMVAVDRTSRLVRQLLVVAKLDSTSEIEHNTNVNIGALLDEVVGTLSAPDAGLQIIIEPSLRHTVLNANRELLMLAMRNLHENAVHHMPDAGAIRWSAETTDEGVVVSVEDQGPGIPDEEMALVTNRFFRGRHKSTVGSGLGLSIVDIALKANGARLSLSNRTDRSGLRARIVWPAGIVHPQPRAFEGSKLHNSDQAALRLRRA
jgi:two-component system sensor histidine kinase QseC